SDETSGPHLGRRAGTCLRCCSILEAPGGCEVPPRRGPFPPGGIGPGLASVPGIVGRPHRERLARAGAVAEAVDYSGRMTMPILSHPSFGPRVSLTYITTG